MGNLLSVLTSPTSTFKRLKEEKGGWLLPMIVLIVLSLIAAWLASPAALEMVEEQLRANPVGDPAVEEFARSMATVGGYTAAVLSIPLSAFIGALLLLLLNLIVNGEATYMQLVKVTLFSKVPTVISMLIIGILVRVTSATSLLDVSLNAGAFVEDKTGTLYAVLSLLDPFGIWGLVLLIIGAAVMTERSRGKIAAWVVGAYVVVSLLAILADSLLGKLPTA